jgi:UDP-N-acetylmuramoyl-tripeptide--D-alanyl-D-alanine ligase
LLTLSASRLAEVTIGTVVSGPGDAMVNGVCIDSRSVHAGCLFAALPGERVDGHAYVADAVRAGARVVLVTRWDDELAGATAAAGRRDVTIVQVDDAARALTALARYHRSRLSCPVVGITGSTGKTTTKDFLAAALSSSLRVTATAQNRNNELGVPLTVLDAGADTDVLVVEMGMRGEGQISDLCGVARPTHGLVTNIGQTHIELLGSVEAIARAKGELVRCVPKDGCVFLNGDDEWSRTLAADSEAAVTFYGLGEVNDVRASDITTADDGRPTLKLTAGDARATLTLPVPGRHNAYNAAAAAAVAIALGVPLESAAEGMAAVSPTEWRMQVFTVASGVTVINDAYNASPASMRAALEALIDIRTQGRRVAVLGDMKELGSLSELAHFRIGELVARLPIDILVTVGDLGRHIADGARAEGMPADVVRTCATVEEAGEVLDDLLAGGDVVLVKASRSMGLERLVEGIVQPRA